MDKDQLIEEFSQLAEQLVAEKTPHLIAKFNGKEWFKKWMEIPNMGLGYNKPIDILESDPDKVRVVLNRIQIVPFYDPFSY